MNTHCPFCEIITNKNSDTIVYVDSEVTAFLDKRPLFPGHVLLVPNLHVVTLGDLPHIKILPLFTAAQRLSRAVPAALYSAGSFLAINNNVSQSVSHLHIHIVPRNPRDGLRGFFWPRKNYDSTAHMKQTAEKIRDAMNNEL
jgi:histidine triad (HIT) family protein